MSCHWAKLRILGIMTSVSVAEEKSGVDSWLVVRKEDIDLVC